VIAIASGMAHWLSGCLGAGKTRAKLNGRVYGE
jgi:hypothetical protein